MGGIRLLADRSDHYGGTSWSLPQVITVEKLALGQNISIDVNKIHLKELYKGIIPLPKKKYDHLPVFCRKDFIMNQHHDFFKNLPFSTNGNRSSDGENIAFHKFR